jgi:dGTPase
MVPEDHLAPYAQLSSRTRGRIYPENEHPYRGPYQRDRDRIVHSTAFRRMEYKTQVFVNHEGDHYRTRLTHTLEVAQIARTIARALGLNEDLTEAIALAHDLGHTPFGHAGEAALNELMQGRGGFEHNLHGLRVVDVLEERYPDHKGLNLTYEVREAFVKHNTAYDSPDATPEGFDRDERATLEAQAVNIADAVAYDAHDLDDGLYSGLVTEKEVLDLPLSRFVVERLKENGVDYRAIENAGVRRKQFVRGMIDLLAGSVIENTRHAIEIRNIRSVEDVRRCRETLVDVSAELSEPKKAHEEFLMERMYQHYRVIRMMRKSTQFLKELFQAFVQTPEILPESYRRQVECRTGDETGDVYRVTADYIAGMTDRYAQEEYKRVFTPQEKT